MLRFVNHFHLTLHNKQDVQQIIGRGSVATNRFLLHRRLFCLLVDAMTHSCIRNYSLPQQHNSFLRAK